MGMPSVNISFTEKAIQSIKRSTRGIIAVILKDAVLQDMPFEVYSITDIPKELSADNKKQLELALIGYVNTPNKLVVYIVADEFKDALGYLETVRFDYLVIPEVNEEGAIITSWIKTQRENGKRIKAVLPNQKADYEGIINFTTEKIIVGSKEYITDEYCSRIAGIIAGTPLTIASTYAPLSEVTDCTRLNKVDMDKAIDNGEFIIYHDGEKVKVGRGINSLTTTTQEKGNQFKKIKIIEAMDMIYDDIRKTAEDSYLGKFANDYDNKCLLMSAIGGYLEELELNGVISGYSIDIDIDTQRNYLKSKGENVEVMSDYDIKIADTEDKVYLTATVKVLDAIEEINLPITI